MKKFVIAYVIFSVIIFAFVYLFTIIQEANARSLDLFYEISEEARTTNDLDGFVKYQSVADQLIDKIETDDYTFHLYQVIALIDKEYKNQFSVFVIPKGDVDHAQVLNDLSDQTGIVLKDNGTGTIVYQTNTDNAYTEYAVSYGIERIGFYYYASVLNQDYDLNITLEDYNAQKILDQTISFTHIEYDENNLGTLTLGYTNDQIEALLDLNAYTRPALLKNIALYLVADILVGSGIYFLIKRKNS